MNLSSTTLASQTTNTSGIPACPLGTLCCVIENYNVESNGVQINIFSTAVVALVFGSILLIMCRMQSTAVRQQLPVYYNYLLFTCATFFIVIVLLLLPRGGSMVWGIISQLLIAPQWVVQLGVVFFLFAPDANASAGWRAVMHSSIVAGVLIVIHVVPIAASPLYCAYCGAIVAQVLLCIFFLGALVLSIVPTRYASRPALRWWAGYQLVAHIVFLTQYILYELQPYDEVTDCIDVIALAGYYLAYAPILLVVVAADSAYWRSHGALLRHYQQQSINGDEDELAEEAEDRAADEAALLGEQHSSAASRVANASLSSGKESPSLSSSSGGNGGASEYTSSTQANVIDFAALDVGGVLGVGQFGVVHEGKFRSRPVAIKLLRQMPSSAISDVMRDLLRESRMMLALRSEHVVECVGVILDDQHLGIVTELMEISLWDALHNTADDAPGVWPLRRTITLMGDVARGLQYLHTRRPPIIHRDIKCHARDTTILMADGCAKPVQCIAPGDRVMGDDGSVRHVMSITSGRDQLVEIGARQQCGRMLPAFKCNLAHVLSLTVAGYPRVVGSAVQFIVALQCAVTDTTATMRVVQRTCRTVDEARALAACTDQRVLRRALGIASDDTLSPSLLLLTRDRVVDIAVRDVLALPDAIAARLELHFAGALEFASAIKSTQDAYEYGRALVLRSCKRGRHRRLPDELKRGRVATRAQLLAGAIDAAARFERLPMPNSAIADDIAFVARSLGLRASRADSAVDIWGGNVSQLPLRTRVAAAPKRARERLQVRLCGRGEFFGFEVDGNHRYVLAESFLVTHNSHNILLRFTKRPVMPARVAAATAATAVAASPSEDRVGSPDPTAPVKAPARRLLEWSWAPDDDLPIAKLCDLGVSRAKLGTTHMTRVGTPQWASPEILRDEPYNEKADIFSFGIVWWECVTRKKPFVSMSPMRVISAVSMDHLRLPLPGGLPRPLATMVKNMWNSTPSKRPSATEVLIQLRDFEPPQQR